MSMSTPGPERVPSTIKVGKTSGQGKPPSSGNRPGSRPGGNRPAGNGGKGGKGRKPVKPIKVASGRNWFPIIIGGVVLVFIVGVIGYGVYGAHESSKPWTEKMAAISGVVNYRAKKNPKIDSRNHVEGPLTYVTSPPVGGDHNPLWQNCMGDVYTAPIANEHAVHSLEHGAVWVTYKPGLPQDQIDALKKKVQGQDYMFMSPYTGLDTNVSLQVWGYQLKLSSANDKRIDQFIKAGRLNASMETGAACSSGNTTTGPVAAASTSTGAAQATPTASS